MTLKESIALYLVSEAHPHRPENETAIIAHTTPYPEMANDLSGILKEWLKTVGLPLITSTNKHGTTFDATESIRKLLITLVDEP